MLAWVKSIEPVRLSAAGDPKAEFSIECTKAPHIERGGETEAAVAIKPSEVRYRFPVHSGVFLALKPAKLRT